jgi:DNA anti-recombination protein RmuC
MLTELDENQQTIIENLGGVSNVVNTLSENVSGLQEGLQQAAEEREAGFAQAAEDRIRIEQSTNDKLEQLREGIAVEFTDAEARRLEQLTGLESRLLQNSAENAEEFARLLENEGQRFDDITAGLSSEILSLQQQAGEFEQQTGERFDEATQERIEMYQGLLGRLDEFRRGAEVDLSETELRVLSEVTGVEERLLQQASEDAEEFNALLADQGVRFEEITDAIRSDIFASEERLTGQIGGLTEDVARVAEDLIRADGRIEEMSAESQQRYNELGLDIEDLSTLVGVNIEALRNDIITQDSALRELFENQGEQLGQDIEDLNTKLEDAREGFSVELSETEANILSEITGLESDFLQSMGELEGGLQDAFGEGFENVQGQVEGIGQQVAGVESRIGEVEEGIGGLESQFQEGLEGLLRFGLGSMFGLGQQQQQISEQQMQQAAMLAARPEIDPFRPQEFAGLGYEAYQDPGMLTQQQPTAQENLAQLIGRLA